MNTREAIESAFAGVAYPGDDNITVCNCADCRRVTGCFRGTTWRDHSLEQLQQHQIAIALFTPEALQYFLPAFLLRTLGAWEDTCLLPFLIAQHFLMPKPGGDPVRQQARLRCLAILTPGQRQALVAYLREYAASGTALAPENVTQAIAHLEGRAG